MLTYQPTRTEALKTLEFTSNELKLITVIIRRINDSENGVGKLGIIASIRTAYNLSLTQAKHLFDELNENDLRDFYEGE